jgi:hypothetical protein
MKQYDFKDKGYPDASITCKVVHLSDGSTATVRAEAPLTVKGIEEVERFIRAIKKEVASKGPSKAQGMLRGDEEKAE